MAILHRKNSLGYKTLRGAEVGDCFMSLIHTCRLNGVNPYAYLLALARHPEAVERQPERWLPWNYPDAANAAGSAGTSGEPADVTITVRPPDTS